jgi:hypothetical protein
LIRPGMPQWKYAQNSETQWGNFVETFQLFPLLKVFLGEKDSDYLVVAESTFTDNISRPDKTRQYQYIHIYISICTEIYVYIPYIYIYIYNMYISAVRQGDVLGPRQLGHAVAP